MNWSILFSSEAIREACLIIWYAIGWEFLIKSFLIDMRKLFPIFLLVIFCVMYSVMWIIVGSFVIEMGETIIFRRM